MTRMLRALITTTLSIALMGLTATAAHAERWWGRDRAADVQQVGISLDPPPCGSVVVTSAPQDTSTDLVGLSVVHGRDDVVLRAHYRGFRAPGLNREVVFDLVTDGRDYQVLVSRWSTDGPPLVELRTAPSEPEPAGCDTYTTNQFSVPCPTGMALSFRAAREIVEVTVPRTCLGDPRWVRAGARSHRLVNGRPRIDVWGRPDIGTVLDAPPLSPRVHRTR